ncbi:MAG TPA: hypothetical protein VEB59_15765 [Gemmatimonadales bacterium]|nr:hypothetical protein [Gemmatimonadales bacterium]
MGAILLLILLLFAVLLNYGAFGARWRGVVGRAMKPALLVGGIGFAAGFFGPIIFRPDANQGPLLGIFITGPGGFLVGLVYGVVREVLRSSSTDPAA